MQNSKITVGQHFNWKPIDGGQLAEAVVTGLRSDDQEGLAPETEAYAAVWIEARAVGGDKASQRVFTIMLGTDGKSYVDGQEVSVDLLNP